MAFRFLYLDQLILPGADADLLAVLQTAAPVGVRVQALKVVMHMGLGVRVIGGVQFPRDVLVGAAVGILAGVIGFYVI